ncbi:zinc-ribbon domain-containing protein [Paracoccus sp. MC1862]|uniref:zinc-ribbon domain-containing protein n=1 Tax=Paracoccus sp. MC1862 TaxID=2760307 RepID=UPI00160125AF|nr:zinc-ribbon domain-containing protein [Paracoccus sp. MC1862]MBB1497453.1 zinc-ribbon domain-containing protein [Paracoccus sp. MC1862]QQO45934.1 zinc-ribbon domain-containing protein [Paracoccus sp. MC1862]
MRLICPRCNAQYEIDAGAVPLAGRDVECSACDHVWRAMPDAEDFDAGARPQLSRRLSESVIGILREEAARELEVRASERRTQRAAERAAAIAAELGGPGPDPAPSSLDGSTDAQGTGRQEPRGTVIAASSGGVPEAKADPAGDVPDAHAQEVEPGADAGKGTTAVHPVSDLGASSASAPPAGRDRSDAAPEGAAADHGGVGPGKGPDAEDLRAPLGEAPRRLRPEATVESLREGRDRVAPSSGAAQPVPAARKGGVPRRRGYAAGFSTAAIIALLVLALYALAPRVADQGAPGAALDGWRSEVDRGRDWLAEQGGAAAGSLRDLLRGE